MCGRPWRTPDLRSALGRMTEVTREYAVSLFLGPHMTEIFYSLSLSR